MVACRAKKRIGPRKEPCGTPEERDATSEKRSVSTTEKVRLERYDENHFTSYSLESDSVGGGR